MTRKISIIILNWNGLKDTLACLETVFKIDYPNFDVAVVDNASSDGSASVVKERFPQAHFIQNKENLGFAEGNNVGMRVALENGADYIFILNNDTVVDKDILNAFVRAADEHP